LNNEAAQSANWTYSKPMAYMCVFGSGFSIDLEHSCKHFLHIQVSTAADIPAWHSFSGPPCCTQMSTVSVINWWLRLSPVYHTDCPTKLRAPETISHSRDMVGAHQNLNGSRDVTTPFSGMVCHPWASTYYLLTRFEVYISTHHEDMKGDTKCQNGVVWGS